MPRKAQEFLQALRQADRVDFEGSPLFAGTRVVADAIADYLADYIAKDDVIYWAVQTSAFRDDWQGELTWYLVIPGGVIEVKARMQGRENGRALEISGRLYAANDISGLEEQVTYRQVADGRAHPESAKAVMDFGGQVLEVASGAYLVPGAQVTPGLVRRLFREIKALPRLEISPPV